MRGTGPAPFSAQYAGLLNRLLGPAGVRETNRRTGQGIAVLPEGAHLTADLRHGLLPVVDVRLTRPRTAAAEVAWFLTGARRVDELHRHGVRIWDDFAEAGEVDTAYGWRWRRAFGRDQLREAVETLVEDASSRRVFVSAWDPSRDGMRACQLNSPCPVGFTLSTAGGALNSTLLLRSSDVFVGLPYDAMGHCVLVTAIAQELELPAGMVSFALAHPHLYDGHRDDAAEGLRRRSGWASRPARVALCPVPLWEACTTSGADALVGHYAGEAAREAAEGRLPTFDPRPEVYP